MSIKPWPNILTALNTNNLENNPMLSLFLEVVTKTITVVETIVDGRVVESSEQVDVDEKTN